MGKNRISLTNAEILLDQPLSNKTTIGIGGNAKYFAKITNLVGLREVIDFSRENKIKFCVLGKGSNVLFDDSVYDGIVINTCGLDRIYQKDKYTVVGAGVTISKLFNYLLAKELSGIERLFGIPATVGGAIVMNASAFGYNISDNLVYVDTFCNGKINRYDKADCDFSYRTSRFKDKEEVIVSATFEFNLDSANNILKIKNDCLSYRNTNQPKGKSCGSIFQNPKGITAGQLIDGAGLKGLKIGDAIVSEKHANFIINQGKATCNQVLELIELIKKSVKEKFSISLREEIKYIGNHYGFNV